ncbi:Nuclease SbcCD subunit C [Microbacterium lemovicicum]|uniref:Nuclease SbcCD subunit C n=2 Tax=Microbacterium lemovicicum TaxID=1072463 RepID=A0A3S9WD61_9MICO|nr:SMC family ATPase [Microbacterium lemovicicum]AZS37991.1 Nuclease SbcCD subunit C [Microbacterium lemovicicum]
MRLHRLEIEGFGPFRAPQTVDFDALARDGIFLIGGRTGAGKSSILDAVCFALYGGVPRYEDGEKRIRSDHATLTEPTRVRLEFSSGGRRWRVERVPTYERLKRNGRGTTLTAAEARLEEEVDGEWVGRASRPVDVGHELGPVLGLTQHQFLQVILLAQGRFARFLLARNDERQTLLRTLFDSKRFGGYEETLERRRKETLERLTLDTRTLLVQLDNAEAQSRAAVPAAEPGGETSEGPVYAGAAQTVAEDVAELPLEERLRRVRQARLRAAHAREVTGAEEVAARAAQSAAEAVHADRVEQRAAQIRRDDARVTLATLESRFEAVGDARETLARAGDAEPLRALMTAADRAHVALTGDEVAHAAALAAWVGAGEESVERAELEQRTDALLADVGAIGVALETERSLPSLREERATTAALLAAAAAETEALTARRADLPVLLSESAAALALAEGRAARLPDAQDRVKTARAVVGAAEEAETRRDRRDEAEAAAGATGRALTRASAALDDLRDRRFRDHAGELAESLVEGDPCPVCGSCEHPQPTARTGDPVTDDDITAAETAKAAAATADQAATAALQSARDDLAAALQRAGGRTPAEARAEADAAEADLAAAETAVAEAATLAAQRAERETEFADVGAAVDALEKARAAASGELVAVDRAIAQAEALVLGARAGHESVQARLSSAEELIRKARALLGAIDAVARRRAAVATADAELVAALEVSPFEGRDAAAAALLDAAARERLTREVRLFDDEIAGLRATLMDLELRMLPAEPVDVETAAALLRDASEQRDEAVRRCVRAAEAAERLNEAVTAAEIAHEAIAEVAAEAEVIERLAHAVAGRAPNTLKMNLETFVLAAELEEIVAAANVRLDGMTQGRYRLQHTDARAARGAASGLGIEVFDAFTGQARPVSSLSGGETFLASLALALGLAEVVTARAGGITLDTLFIDEGFGSLDGDTLDVAMQTLDELRQGGRVVGVISHVEAMKDQLPAQLTVRTTPHGDSVIEQEVPASV